MNKKDYESAMVRQAKGLSDFGKALDESFSMDKMAGLLPNNEIFSAMNVIITGCGDSYMAGIAMKPVFEKLAGVKVDVQKNIEFTRHYDSSRLGSNPGDPLVIVISNSGGVSRVVEAVERANKYGANTLAVTNNPTSPVGSAAKRVFNLELPELEPAPGVLTYVASTAALAMIALRIGWVKGKVGPADFDKYRKAIFAHIAEYESVIDSIDDKMFEMAQVWKDYKAYDFLGDGSDFATAFFGAAKIVECFGGICSWDDYENWCHVGNFFREPEKIGTAVVISEASPSFGSAVETIKHAVHLERPLMILTDAFLG